jgi:hypothetical protein
MQAFMPPYAVLHLNWQHKAQTTTPSNSGRLSAGPSTITPCRHAHKLMLWFRSSSWLLPCQKPVSGCRFPLCEPFLFVKQKHIADKSLLVSHTGLHQLPQDLNISRSQDHTHTRINVHEQAFSHPWANYTDTTTPFTLVKDMPRRAARVVAPRSKLSMPCRV